MEIYAGMDVSLELTSVCVVDAKGKVVKEAKVDSNPQALVAFFNGLGFSLTRIGLEADPLSASTSPILPPICWSANARFTLTVDLPTPPLPLPTAMTWRIPGSFSAPADGWDDAPGVCWDMSGRIRSRCNCLASEIELALETTSNSGMQRL